MTTENVAILFTDIVGSTKLFQRLSAETADEVRRVHFAILRQAIAEAGGTEVKNLEDHRPGSRGGPGPSEERRPVMEPRCPRRRRSRPSPWRRPGATLDTGRWFGPTLSALVSADPRLTGQQLSPPCPQASHPSGILDQDR